MRESLDAIGDPIILAVFGSSAVGLENPIVLAVELAGAKSDKARQSGLLLRGCRAFVFTQLQECIECFAGGVRSIGVG